MKTDPIRRAFQNNRCELIATLYLFFSYIVMVFNSVVRTFISNTHKLDTAFLYGLLLVGILLSVRQLFSRIAFWQIMSVMLLGSALVLGILFSRSQNVNFSVAQKIATTCLPAFFLLGVVRDYSAFKRFLTTAAEATPYLVACVFLFLKFGHGRRFSG